MNPADKERKRKNIRLAWILGVLAILIMISAIPFWKGLLNIAIGNTGGL